MTYDEWRESYFSGQLMNEAMARAAWDFAVLFEREACAELCDEMREFYSDYKDTALLNGDIDLSNAASGEPRACEYLASAIRARGHQ